MQEVVLAGSAPVSVDEELRRVLPVIQRLVAEVPLPISIDTYKSEVAKGAVAAGAAMLRCGLDEQKIEAMVKTNPARLLGLP